MTENKSFSIKLDVYVTVNSMKEAEDIAHDLGEVLDKCGVTNKVNLTDDISS